MNACSMYYSKLYDIDIDFQFVENTVLLSTILCELLSLLISHEHQKCDHTSVDWFDIHSATTEKWWWVNILNLFFVCLAFHFRSDLQWHYSNIRIRKAKTNMAIIWFFSLLFHFWFCFCILIAFVLINNHVSHFTLIRTKIKTQTRAIHTLHVFFLVFRFLKHTAQREENNREMLTIKFGSSGISSNSISIIFCSESIFVSFLNYFNVIKHNFRLYMIAFS